MVGVQNEQQVECLGLDRIDFVGFRRHGEHHLQEVLGVVQIVPRIHERLPDAELVSSGRDGRQLGDDAMREDVPMLGIGSIHLGMVVSGH